MIYQIVELEMDSKKNIVKAVLELTEYNKPIFEAEGRTIREALLALVDKLDKYKDKDANQMTLPNV